MTRPPSCALLVFGLLLSVAAKAQVPDSVFALGEFMVNVQLYHPVARQSRLLNDAARAELLYARGFLDPEIEADWSEKNFDDKFYYQLYSTKLKVPTAYGVSFVGGYENTDGIFLNPENTTDPMGLWNVGVEVDLLQGLLVNERRTALDRARVVQELNENERLVILNDLLSEAGSAYVDWQQFYEYSDVLDSNVVLAETYFASTVTSFVNGEYTAMDTLEAFIALQDALTTRQKNDAEFVKARQKMENYLWFDGTPLELQEGIVPEPLDTVVPEIDVNVDLPLIQNTPVLQYYVNMQELLEVEQRLKREKLKPKLKVKYNPLLATSQESVRPNYLLGNYKWGFDFSMPLLFRQARADVQLGEIKLQENALKFQTKQIELLNKVQASIIQLGILRDQLALTEDNVIRYDLLLEGENIKFVYGESSVFLLNKRQEKYIQSLLKVIELRAKITKELINYRNVSNTQIDVDADMQPAGGLTPTIQNIPGPGGGQ